MKSKFTGGYPRILGEDLCELCELSFFGAISLLFLLYSLLFCITRWIHVNESTQIRPCPWMYACNQIHGLVGRRPLISVVEGNHRLDPRIICGSAYSLAKRRPSAPAFTGIFAQ